MRIGKRSLALAIAVTAIGQLSCSARGKTGEAVSEEPKADVRVNLSKYGLPRNFFQPNVDTECASQIIAYRFVVWLDSDNVVVGFNTSPNCRLSPDRRVNGSARLLAFDGKGVFKLGRKLTTRTQFVVGWLRWPRSRTSFDSLGGCWLRWGNL